MIHCAIYISTTFSFNSIYISNSTIINIYNFIFSYFFIIVHRKCISISLAFIFSIQWKMISFFCIYYIICNIIHFFYCNIFAISTSLLNNCISCNASIKRIVSSIFYYLPSFFKTFAKSSFFNPIFKKFLF